MKTILASVLVLSTLAAPLPAFAQSTTAEGAYFFPDRGYDRDSSQEMLRDVQTATQSGLYTVPSHRRESPRTQNRRLTE